MYSKLLFTIKYTQGKKISKTENQEWLSLERENGGWEREGLLSHCTSFYAHALTTH